MNPYAVFETNVANSNLLGSVCRGTVMAYSLEAAYMLAHLEFPQAISIEVSELVKPWTGIEN